MYVELKLGDMECRLGCWKAIWLMLATSLAANYWRKMEDLVLTERPSLASITDNFEAFTKQMGYIFNV